MKNNNEFVDLNIIETSSLIVLISVQDKCYINIKVISDKINFNKIYIFIEKNHIIIDRNNYYYNSGLDPPMSFRKWVA